MELNKIQNGISPLNKNNSINPFAAQQRVNFRQAQAPDSFSRQSCLNLCSEKEIKKMIAKNPEIRRILAAHNLKICLNIKELESTLNNHCKDTQKIAASIAQYLPESFKQNVNLADLKQAALLHDFGKVLIPAKILNKNDSLTKEEYKIMNLHSELGYQLLKNSELNENVLNLIRFHHINLHEINENMKNYIPDINQQILNLADRYSALTEKRVYKSEYDAKKALTIIYSEVKKGNIHPILFYALVKSVINENSKNHVKNC